MKILSYKNDPKGRILDFTFIAFTINLIYDLFNQFLRPHTFESWQVSEWLINFQGGYVRRGLPGELLYFFAQNFNINISLTIKIFSLLCLAALVGFFVFHFIQKGFSLYILPSCLLFATHITNGMYWTKRDYLILLLFIAGLSIFDKCKHVLCRFFAINSILILAIHIHEGIALFTLPILSLIIYAKFRNHGIWKSIIFTFSFILPSVLSFFLMAKFHGDATTAQKIWDSWVDVIGASPATLGDWSHGVVSSIRWDKEMAFKFHRDKNFWSQSGEITSLSFWILITPVIFYIAVNYLYVFRKTASSFTNESRILLAGIMVFQLICVMPFFLYLSCDLGRIIFYWIASSFIVYFLIPERILTQIFPKIYLKAMQNFTELMDRVMRPTKTVVALLLLIIGIPTAGFSIDFIVESSIAGNMLILLSRALNIFM